ncbi:MAG: hypothetical protein WC055_02270 [Melioribacteraceae bacterium]
MDEEEVTPEEFQIEMMESHHKEMIAAIRSIKFPEQKDSSPVLQKLNSSIDSMISKLNALQSPTVNVEKTDQTEVTNLLKELISSVNKLGEKEEKPEKKEFIFDIVRDGLGNIKSVKAKQV